MMYMPVSDFVMVKALPYSETVIANVYLGDALVNTLSTVGSLKFEHSYGYLVAKFSEWDSYLQLEMDKYFYGSRLDPPFSLLQP